MSNGQSEKKRPGTKIVEAAIKKLKSKGIPTPEIIEQTIESSVDSIQKSIETASKRASLEQTPFPNPNAEVAELDLWKSGWTVVDSSSESEKDIETNSVPSSSQERERSRSPRARNQFSQKIKDIFSKPLNLRKIPSPTSDNQLKNLSLKMIRLK
jgi:hypothetical protein